MGYIYPWYCLPHLIQVTVILRPSMSSLGFPGSSAGKESACNAGDPNCIPGSGRSPGERIVYKLHFLGLPWWFSQSKIRLQCSRPGFDPWVGKILLEEGMATHSSILAWRIPMDRGAWWTTVHGVAKSQTRLSAQFSIWAPYLQLLLPQFPFPA